MKPRNIIHDSLVVLFLIFFMLCATSGAFMFLCSLDGVMKIHWAYGFFIGAFGIAGVYFEYKFFNP